MKKPNPFAPKSHSERDALASARSGRPSNPTKEPKSTQTPLTHSTHTPVPARTPPKAPNPREPKNKARGKEMTTEKAPISEVKGSTPNAPVPLRGPRGRLLPGQSLNPGGRPVRLQADIRIMCREVTPEVVKALTDALKTKGERVSAANTLLAYGYGKPQSTTNIRVIRSITDLSEDELRFIVGEGVEDHGIIEPGEDEQDNP